MLGDPAELAEGARDAVANPTNDVFVSAASVWEVAIKARSGKLAIAGEWVDHLVEIDVNRLSISFEHARVAGALPPIHADPFDRMLVAQAQVEQMTLVTRDRRIAAYSTPTLTA